MSDRSSSSSDDDYDEPSAKRSKTVQRSPTSFVTWNVNGLVSRCVKDEAELERLLRETGDPDVLCLQEVRLKASSPNNRGTPLPSDYKSVKNTMESHVFRRYDKYWSLADKKYAGTLTLIHRRLAFPAQDAAFSMPSALSLLLSRHNLTRKDIGVTTSSDKKGDAPNSPSKAAKKQTSMKSFFAIKPSSKKEASTTANYNSKAFVSDHHHEGRFQFFSFPTFDLIQTYVPNNGTKEESFQRRREWDRDMKEFLQHRRLVLEKAASQCGRSDQQNQQQQQQQQRALRDRPLLWCGDMNVAKDYRDGTHWEQRQGDDTTSSTAAENATSTVYEWWTDESKCFAGGQANKLDPRRAPGEKGMPSFTPNERRRFGEILDQADFSDVWRDLHPDGCTTDVNNNPKYKTQWDRPNWSWRGHLSKDANAYGSKYQGKGQRLDLFLLSPAALTNEVVEKCEILGYGELREGLFCGSDHCASVLRLKRPL